MKSKAFSLVDLIGVLVVVALIAGLVFPSIQASRESARRTACMDKLRQIGVAIHQYHDVYESLPGHKVGPGGHKRISAFTFLLPHLGYEALYDDIAKQRWQHGWNKAKVDAKGKPVKDSKKQDVPGPFCTTISEFLCPDDTAWLSKKDDDIGFNNYVFSHGDWITGQDETFSRGPFVPEHWLTFASIVDGTANTIAMSERCIASNKRVAPGEEKPAIREYDGTVKTQGNLLITKDDADGPESAIPSIVRCFQKSNGDILNEPDKLQIDRGRVGTRWSDGQHFFTILNTILPPNGPSCILSGDDRKPLISTPTSYHTGGVNALMVDGQVRFVSNDIDYGGDFTNKKCVKEGPSPFGVWGALGSIADTKPVGEEVK